MRTRGRPALPAAALGVALCAAGAAAAAMTTVAAKSTDSVQLRKGVLEIRSPSGVGSAQLLSEDGKWPNTPVKVQLKGFTEIEHFRATAGALTFLCELRREGGVSTTRNCRLGEAPAGEVQWVEDGFVVAIPAALFGKAEDSVVLEWVDRWR